jgi:excisionase family DNA binding protein
VLPDFEINQLNIQVNPSRVADICDAVEHVARRLEEFWESRPIGQHRGQRSPAAQPMSKPALHAQPPADWRRKDWLRTDEVAEILEYTPRYVYTLIKDGKLDRAQMTGGRRSAVRVSRESVEKMLATKEPRTE